MMSLTDTIFGRKIVKEGSAAAAVSPCKTRDEVEKEAAEGKELYRKVSTTLFAPHDFLKSATIIA